MHFLYAVMLGVSFVFIGLNHPITLGMVLIAHTALIGVVTGVLAGNFWFSYILFLVFLGGVLVLFIYMTSLASNEKFTFSWGDFAVLAGWAGFLLGALLLLFTPSSGGFDQTSGWAPSVPLLGSCLMVLKLYSSHSFYITLFLIFYLLYALVVCANLVGGYPGALRNFN